MRPEPKPGTRNPEPDPTAAFTMHLANLKATLVATNADLSDSQFHDVNLGEAQFSDVNLAEAQFNDVNLSEAKLSNVNLTKVVIEDCDLTGMKINGVLVTDLLRAHGKQPNSG
jgi:uncharacterized protein YjbI with pentapeptide repeats